MELRTPYVPGYALEMDCLVLFSVVVAAIWFVALWRGQLAPGGRASGGWWICGWLASAWVAITPWFAGEAGLPSWVATISPALLTAAAGMAVGAFVRALTREARPGRRLPALLAALLAVVVAALLAARGWIVAVKLLGAIGIFARLLILRPWREHSVASWVALLAASGVVVGRLGEAGWQETLWLGTADSFRLHGWGSVLAFALTGVGGVLWALAETRWRNGVFPQRAVVAGLVFGLLTYVAVAVGDRYLRRRLSDDVQLRLTWMASELSQAEVLELYGGKLPADNPVHRGVWEKLRAFRLRDPAARYVYLLGLRGGQWYFLSTGTTKWLAELPWANLHYREERSYDAWQLPGDRAVFQPPSHDDWGLTVTTAVPIWNGGSQGRVLLCVDYQATAWAGDLMALRLPSLTLLMVALGCGSLWLAAARRRAEADAASLVVAAVSHELRTPLQSVLGHAELLARTELSGPQRTALDRMRSEGEQLAHLIRQMLDLSALKAGVFVLHERRENPGRIARDACETVMQTARQKHLELRAEGLEGLPPAVMLDGVRLRQVLVNLLSNAVRYTERGCIVLQMTAVAGRLVARIEDTGMGMSAAEKATLFRPFVRGQQAGFLAQEGSGLGLAITREIVIRMGGSIAVQSSEGVGSVFEISVPARVTESVPESGPVACKLAGRSVLLVEDHPVVAELLAQYVAALGGSPAVVTTLAEARDWLGRHGVPDVLVSDSGLPDGDGLLLGAEPIISGSGSVWCIALSANDGSEAKIRATRHGWDLLLGKPCGLEEFARAIARCPWLAARNTDDVVDPERTADWPGVERLEQPWLRELRADLDELGRLDGLGEYGVLEQRAHYLRNGAVVLGHRYRPVARLLGEIEESARLRKPAQMIIRKIEPALLAVAAE